MDLDDIINDVIEFAKTFMGIPYRWHREGDIIQKDDKFWAENSPVISVDYIKSTDKCIVCTGLINLIRRYRKLEIPGLDGSLGDVGIRFAGTTGIWFEYLQVKNYIEPLDITRAYPKGTLLLRNFTSVLSDQGHVAILITNNTPCIMNEYILHSFAEYGYEESKYMKNVGKTDITLFKDSHFWRSWTEDGYYTHICLPNHWLF